MKKQYSATFKVKLVVELLRGEKSLTQLASEHQVHPNQLRHWRDWLRSEAPTLFDKTQPTDLLAAHEREKEELDAQMGLLTRQLPWLKKKSGLNPERR
jgi:transposase-like protein